MKKPNLLPKTDTYLFLFFIASFFGFIWETIILFVQRGEFCNRGFFYGPWLPVYGSGSVLLYACLSKKKNRPLFCFFASALIGGATELFTGWLLNTFFGLRYWEYTGQFLNFQGYICLYSVLGFALAGTFLICIAAPFLLKLWSKIPAKIRGNILGVLVVLFAVDAAISLIFPNSGNGVTF